ncbi:hypothetical protein TDB9533_02837 [Thalassocella blandensis]|nr:hypothetical protein TDB9533_02837 [Thalassocella blandensis]
MLGDLAGKTVTVGARAESLARKHLEQHGLRYIERNFRCRQGEIDLIMQDGQTLVFVEVRFRKSSHYGSAVESITPAKQKKVVTATQLYLQKKKLGENQAIRFDVVGVEQNKIEWIKNAF